LKPATLAPMPFASFFVFEILSILEAIIGVNVSDTITEVAIVIVTTAPSGAKISPVRSPSIVKGRNTAIIVNVVEITAIATSFVP